MKFSKIIAISIIPGCLLAATSGCLGQSHKQDSLKQWKNSIKVNLTSNILYTSPQFEYERIVGKNQSFSVQVGIIALPFGATLAADSINFGSSIKKSGYSTTVDYRFYLAKENKDPAPHGVYIGPYVSYYHFENTRDLQIGSSPDPLVLESKINVFSIGAQLGYQFVLGKKKRWTIDCILIAPSITQYRANMKLIGSVDPSQVDEDLQKILEGMAARFPLVGDLLKDKVSNFNGTANAWSAGLRYSIHLGFRF